MSPWSSFPFVRLTLAFMSGIIAAFYCEDHVWGAAILLGLFLFTYLLIIISIPRPTFHQWSAWVGLLGLSSIFLVGYLHLWMHQAYHTSNHLIHWSDEIEAYEAVSLEDARAQKKQHSMKVAVKKARIQGKWRLIQGKVRLYFPKQPAIKIAYGNVLLVKGPPQPIAPPLNPYEFDYKCFLRCANIYHQHFVQRKAIIVVSDTAPNHCKVWLRKVRRACQSILAQHIHGSEERAIVLALLLGLKEELDVTIKSAYASAGTLHVLAVSGLHVGILYWFVRILLRFFRYIPRLRWLASSIALMLLWGYALVTGFAPSVMRATTMFTIFMAANMVGRQHNNYNSLAIAAFLLLLLDPFVVFAVSFQLSYLAVLGIVYLQPKLYRWFTFRNLLLDKLWLWSSISLSAQLATMPLGLYYFHQFPTYFLVSNWILVPAAFFILWLGFSILLTSYWTGLSRLLAWVLERMVFIINQFTFFVKDLPGSTIEDIYIDRTTLWLLYGLFIAFLCCWKRRKWSYLLVANVLSILLLVLAIKTYCYQQVQQKLIFYSIKNHSVVAFIKGRSSTICADKAFNAYPQKYTYHVKPSQLVLGITTSTHYTFEEATENQQFPLQVKEGFKVAIWQGKKIIFIEKACMQGPDCAKKISTDFLVIEGNTLHTLQPLLAWFDFDTLVIGASNQIQVAQQLQLEAEQYKLKSHNLCQKGALIASW